MPATLQATIAARIDRLDPAAKRTLSAAAVIGSRFSRGLLETLEIDPVLEDLVSGEFIDQITFTGDLLGTCSTIRSFAPWPTNSNSNPIAPNCTGGWPPQSKSGDPAGAEENAALIAEHLEAAGDLHAAYGWHMRAGTWSTNRDIAAAHVSWERAVRLADAMPEDDPNRLTMRLAPRTLICLHGYRIHTTIAGTRFEELQELCRTAGTKCRWLSEWLDCWGLRRARAHSGVGGSRLRTHGASGIDR